MYLYLLICRGQASRGQARFSEGYYAMLSLILFGKEHTVCTLQVKAALTGKAGQDL